MQRSSCAPFDGRPDNKYARMVLTLARHGRSLSSLTSRDRQPRVMAPRARNSGWTSCSMIGEGKIPSSSPMSDRYPL